MGKGGWEVVAVVVLLMIGIDQQDFEWYVNLCMYDGWKTSS